MILCLLDPQSFVPGFYSPHPMYIQLATQMIKHIRAGVSNQAPNCSIRETFCRIKSLTQHRSEHLRTDPEGLVYTKTKIQVYLVSEFNFPN